MTIQGRKNALAGDYLPERQVTQANFNSYGARRGNHEVMMRDTFANIGIRNEMLQNVEGGVTKHLPSGEQMPIYDAAMRYKQEGVPLVIFGGKEYGTGSSRDRAAKGTMLLGAKAVIVESFECIHCSNLVGMGVLPLAFKEGVDRKSLGITGEEIIDITGLKPDQGHCPIGTKIAALGAGITFIVVAGGGRPSTTFAAAVTRSRGWSAFADHDGTDAVPSADHHAPQQGIVRQDRRRTACPATRHGKLSRATAPRVALTSAALLAAAQGAEAEQGRSEQDQRCRFWHRRTQLEIRVGLLDGVRCGIRYQKSDIGRRGAGQIKRPAPFDLDEVGGG